MQEYYIEIHPRTKGRPIEIFSLKAENIDALRKKLLKNHYSDVNIIVCRQTEADHKRLEVGKEIGILHIAPFGRAVSWTPSNEHATKPMKLRFIDPKTGGLM